MAGASGPPPHKRPRITDSGSDEEAPPESAAVRRQNQQYLEEKRMNGRSGGAYVPRYRRKAMTDQMDPQSEEYQRMMWEALRKSLNGLINKVNRSNIKYIVKDLFGENLIRGKGLLCRAIMKAQVAAESFTVVFASLVAVLNTKLPEIGELLLIRLTIAWRMAYRRNDKRVAAAICKFLAHLTNQRICDPGLVLEILVLLLERPSDDSVDVAVTLLKEVGHFLESDAPQLLNPIFDRMRSILNEGDIDKRTEWMLQGLFMVRQNKFNEYCTLPEELDLIDEEDQIQHEIDLKDQKLEPLRKLDYFHFDPNFTESENQYDEVKKAILGDGSDSDDEDDGSDDSEDSDAAAQEKQDIVDVSEAKLVQLRRTIYLTIMSSLDFEECAHKILKSPLGLDGREGEVCNILIECCAQERTYLRYYGLLGQRFCLLKREYQDCFDGAFQTQYSNIHRLETSKLRNVAKFFAHLLWTDALPWTCLRLIQLTEEGTTSSSRIFIKFLFQELAEYLGLQQLNSRLQDPSIRDAVGGLFPSQNPKDTRFAVNFFTSIGLGGLTDDLRERLRKAFADLKAQQANRPPAEESDDSSSSSSSSSDSD